MRVIIAMICAVWSLGALALEPVEVGLATDTVDTYKWAVQLEGITASRGRERVVFSSRPFAAECGQNIGVVRANTTLRGPIELARANGTLIRVRIYDTDPDRQGGCIIQAVEPR